MLKTKYEMLVAAIATLFGDEILVGNNNNNLKFSECYSCRTSDYCQSALGRAGRKTNFRVRLVAAALPPLRAVSGVIVNCQLLTTSTHAAHLFLEGCDLLLLELEVFLRLHVHLHARKMNKQRNLKESVEKQPTNCNLLPLWRLRGVCLSTFAFSAGPAGYADVHGS